MAAPFYAYTNRELNVQDSTGTKKHYVAKLDTSYNTMKSRFYLDDFVNIDGVGVVGCVTIGGENASMHNLTTRGGVGRNGNMILLNDGGLNTYATSYSDPMQVIRVDSNSFTYSVTSSYYGATTRVRIYYKYLGNWTLYSDRSISLPKNQTSTYTDYNLFNGFVVGTLAEFKATVTNEEGDKDVILESIFVQPTGLVTSRYNVTWASWAYNNTSGTTTKQIQFAEWPFTVGTEVLFSPEPTISEDFSGYYIANDGSVDKWLKVEKSGSKYYIVQLGLCQMGDYPAGDPGNSYPMPFVIAGIKYTRAADYNDLHDACVLGTTGSDILYRDEATYFENWNPTTNEFTNRYNGYFLDNNGCVQYEFTNGFSPDAPLPPTP